MHLNSRFKLVSVNDMIRAMIDRHGAGRELVSGTFVLKTIVPWNIRSHHGTFVLGSRDHSFSGSGTFVPWNFRSRERINPADFSRDYDRSNTKLIVYVK